MALFTRDEMIAFDDAAYGLDTERRCVERDIGEGMVIATTTDKPEGDGSPLMRTQLGSGLWMAGRRR